MDKEEDVKSVTLRTKEEIPITCIQTASILNKGIHKSCTIIYICIFCANVQIAQNK